MSRDTRGSHFSHWFPPWDHKIYACSLSLDAGEWGHHALPQGNIARAHVASSVSLQFGEKGQNECPSNNTRSVWPDIDYNEIGETKIPHWLRQDSSSALAVRLSWLSSICQLVTALTICFLHGQTRTQYDAGASISVRSQVNGRWVISALDDPIQSLNNDSDCFLHTGSWEPDEHIASVVSVYQKDIAGGHALCYLALHVRLVASSILKIVFMKFVISSACPKDFVGPSTYTVSFSL